VTAGGLSLVVTNCRVGTGDPLRPWATALGLREGKLAVLGAAAEILKMISADTRVIDAAGQLLTLPAGMTVGNPAAVTVASDGRVIIHSSRE
jgi:predicted amidohydrolase YtcJ